MVLLITGAMTPGAGVQQVTVSDFEERKKQYIESLMAAVNSVHKARRKLARKGLLIKSSDFVGKCSLAESGRIISIVYCDNSEPDDECFEEVRAFATKKGVPIEILTFKGDYETTALKGKGHGEGEITKYAMEHSEMMAKDSYFAKLTGRLKIDNMSKILCNLDTRKCYFNIPNHTMRHICDTRFYAMPIAGYKAYYYDAYKKVDDSAGYFLEHAFTDALKKTTSVNFPFYPRYEGFSGTSGGQYTYVKWKSKIKDFLSKLQFYRVN